MKYKNTFENSVQTLNEIETKNTDIFEQIKKKTEEMTQSEASLKLFKNLSNPTNLTNPQIIIDSNHFEEKIASRKNNKKVKLLKKIKLKQKLIFNNDNSLKHFPKSKSDISIINQNYNLIGNDISKIINNINIITNNDSILNSQRNKIILKKIDKKKIIKSNNSQLNINNKNSIRNLKKAILVPKNMLLTGKNINTGKQDDIDILEKFKNSKTFIPHKKSIIINEIESFNKDEFKKDMYHIKLLQYNAKNKKEEYDKIILNKNTEIKLLDETIKQYEKSKNNIENIYKKKYISYISFLNRKIEKENIINNDLINKKHLKLIENKILLKKINKLKDKKKIINKWLLLQIQVKEKLLKIPEYYEYIIEDNMSLKEINEIMKCNITQNEYDRIMDYKGKNVYNDANKFIQEYIILEDKSIKELNKNTKFSDNTFELKNELERDKKIEQKINEDNIINNKLIEELKKLKKKNIYLNKLLNSIKNNRKNNIKSKIKSDIYNLTDISNKLYLQFQLDSNYNFSNYYNYKKEKSLLYNLIIFLYKWASQNQFKEMKNISINFNNLTEEEIMLKILEYAEIVMHLLLMQKKYYYSNDILKNKYIKVFEIVDKGIRKEKSLIKLEIENQKEIEKLDKIKEKINNNYNYSKYKQKIDYNYFRKDMKKFNKMNLDKLEKTETKFEDFLYDIYEYKFQ